RKLGVSRLSSGPKEASKMPQSDPAEFARSGGNNPPGRRRNHRPANLSGARIVVGHRIASMSDADIVEMYNEILDAQWRLLQQWDKTVIEEPLGEKQIDNHEDSDQWVPRGDVLRCIIDDAGTDGEVTIHIDDKELSLA